MFRTKVCSGLLGLALLAVAAGGQQPAEKGKAPPPKPADPLDAAVANAVRSHPDVRLAQAKLQAAEAELAQAKLKVAQRVAAAHAAVESAKAGVATEEIKYRQVKTLREKSVVSEAEAHMAEQALLKARAALAAAEAELRAAEGAAPGQPAAKADRSASWQQLVLSGYAVDSGGNVRLVDTGTVWASPPAPGSPADQLRGLVGKRVKLDLPGRVTLDKALAELVKQAGLGGITVRYPEWATAAMLRNPPLVGPLQGEQTVAGWLQLMLDDFNRSLPTVGVPPGYEGKYDAYVREYGLLITKTDLVPPGAVTLTEFARHAQAEKPDAGKK